ncbi:tRNA uracil 4-sulfurtransferase ThiI [Candidatus Izimaplasma bacterium ZiA1]|uniref:tRNA uracil 4-sulfurtransferase ThiI n=1 Tax=Candidatus Izimoplasma sp. ZiA1 TaxID=2024899 RepID=UPI00143B313D
MYERILVRYGDLTLKGKNKKVFIDRVNNLIQNKVNNEFVKYERNHDRLYILLNGQDHEDIIKSLDRVSGLSSYSLITKTEKDLDSIYKKAIEVVTEEVKDKTVTFKVESKRADKLFPFTSQEISKKVAREVLLNTDFLKVDVHNPELTLHVEVRQDAAFVYCKKIKGMGGFPVGVAGKGLLMLSGGIDSPVAGYLAMKQGIEIEGIHFESTPLTSIESAQKVIDLTEKLARYSPRGKIKLYMVPFMELHEALLNYIPESYNITIMRRMMYRISEKIAKQNDDIVLLNGESVGQVASQTLKSMSVINDVVNMPVIRPLSTYDKLDIIKLSKKIECYETSIKPFEDCCTVYVPKKPTTAPRLDKCIEFEKKFDFDKLVDETVERTRYVIVSDTEHKDITLEGLVVREVI